MARNMELIEEGDFITYKGHLMAVVDMQNKDVVYVFNQDSHSTQRFDRTKLEKNKGDFKIVKKLGCKALIRAIYDDMNLCERGL